jgi:hypothetical protein
MQTLAASPHLFSTTRSLDTLEKIVCLRNSRMDVTVLKKIYVDEAFQVGKCSVFIDREHPKWHSTQLIHRSRAGSTSSGVLVIKGGR